MKSYFLNSARFILFLLMTFSVSAGFSQDEEVNLTEDVKHIPRINKASTKNALYFEVGGNGFIYSLNYERIILEKPNFKTAIRGGAGFVPNNFIFNVNSYFFPVEIVGLFGKKSHHFELGVGNTLMVGSVESYNHEEFKWNTSPTYHLFIPVRIGYRYQRREGGFVFRAGATPILDYRFVRIVPMAGISVGKSF
jgi:hypothetical protein